ncbi:hypothetical protein D3C76_1220460 [compost metagenome]
MYGAIECLAAHQLDFHPVALPDPGQLGFFKIAADIKRTAVDQRQQRSAGGSVITLSGQQVGDKARDRRDHPRALQIELGLGQCSDGQLHIGLRQHQIGLISQQVRLGDGCVRIGFLPFFAGNRRAILECAST